jgi:hypothetical protein
MLIGAEAIRLEINAVRQHLRAKPGESSELPDRDSIRAIDEMPMRDCRVFTDDQFGASIGFAREVRRRTERKSGDPVAVADQRMLAQMKQGDVLAQREIADRGVRFHHQTVGADPGEPDARRRMNLVAELPNEQFAPDPPGQKQAEEHEEFLHGRFGNSGAITSRTTV